MFGGKRQFRRAEHVFKTPKCQNIKRSQGVKGPMTDPCSGSSRKRRTGRLSVRAAENLRQDRPSQCPVGKQNAPPHGANGPLKLPAAALWALSKSFLSANCMPARYGSVLKEVGVSGSHGEGESHTAPQPPARRALRRHGRWAKAGPDSEQTGRGGLVGRRRGQA